QLRQRPDARHVDQRERGDGPAPARARLVLSHDDRVASDRATRMNARRAWLLVIAAVSVLIVVASLFVGHDVALSTTFLELRGMRAAAAFLAGAALAVSGVVLQTLFRNPLVDPGILGTTAGASL